jgi:hypothetical protein
MEVKKISQTTIDIQVRFFQAINMLIAQKKLRGMKTFCGNYDFSKAKYTNLKNAMLPPHRESKYKLIDIEALHHIVKDYGVSAEWLLTGSGGMFK